MNDYEVRAVFHVKDTIRDQSLEWWKTEIDKTVGYYGVEDYMEGDPPQPEDFTYGDVAKYVAKEWNASGDYYQYVDADQTAWVIVEKSGPPEVCTKCGKVKSAYVHRNLADERKDHEFTTVKQEEKCVHKEFVSGLICGLLESDIVHHWPRTGGGEHSFEAPK